MVGRWPAGSPARVAAVIGLGRSGHRRDGTPATLRPYVHDLETHSRLTRPLDASGSAAGGITGNTSVTASAAASVLAGRITRCPKRDPPSPGAIGRTISGIRPAGLPSGGRRIAG